MSKIRIFSILFAVVLLCSSALFVSCGGGDDEGSSSSGVENTLISYCWKSDPNYDYGIYGSDNDLYLDREVWTYYFTNDNKGFIKTNRHKEDTYFGSKNEELTTEIFWYIDDDGYIKTGGSTWRLEGDKLVQQYTSTPTILYKTSITSADRNYLELAPYYSLEGTNRAKFDVDYEVKPHGMGYNIDDGVIFYPLDVKVKLSAKDHIYSRHIGSIEVSFKFTHTHFNNLHNYWVYTAKPVETIDITKDEDIVKEYPLLFNVTGDASVRVTIRAWDYQLGKYYTMEDRTIFINEPEYIKRMK